MWGCNRFLMIRDLWKLVHVPGLTFANAVTYLSPATREWLERQQREAGRTALGCHGHVANEAVQGDVGWWSFEAREAASKIAYRGRLLFLPSTRWACRVSSISRRRACELTGHAECTISKRSTAFW
ncbi:hypothetical protein HPB49_000943 [Dermacentor silvarum]|uniref:Uncharacterized protein n=1 Tax=Dermacentor silvarum TaxID=543639 RepID=A0ACB8DS60_DERSI|nr:hypothetical protein HPB49_000943 [Dermacentor silvarum]